MVSRIESSLSSFLHTYEAYRIPKGTKVKDSAGKEIVLSQEEDQLVLTERSSRQLVKDRRAYNGMLQANAELAAQKTQQAASEKIAQDQAKAMAVYRAMARGDVVPASDESKLMEYDAEMYQAAKMAQMMAQKAERQMQKAQWSEKEEEAYLQKMDKLCAESNEAALAVATGSQEFSDAQKLNIVEVDSSGVDFSNMQTMSLGGVTGVAIDLSL